MRLTEGQRKALRQVEAIAAEGDAVELLGITDPTGAGDDLYLNATLRCAGFEHRPGGLKLRDREAFRVAIPPDFPFKPPSVEVRHRRWAGSPHVQFARHLCVYQAPATEWDPADGVFGFIDRLRYWLEKAALGELDPIGGPLHPPAAYARNPSLPIVIPRMDTPAVGDAAWLGIAEVMEVSPRRLDIGAWTDPLNEPWPARAAVAVLLPKPLTWEYPTKVEDLIAEFDRQGVSRRLLLALLRVGAMNTADGQPLLCVVGSPMRRASDGSPRQHLEVWYLQPWIVQGLRLSIEKFSEHQKLQEIGEAVEQIVLDWAGSAPIEFCYVREDRPEVTERRDAGSPLDAFRGKTVAIWGCGALGGWIADALARASVGHLVLYDKAEVSLGILVRQPYENGDVGYGKAEVLRQRLIRVRPELEIDAHGTDVLTTALEADDWTDAADVVIDTTAAVAVAEKLERVRRLRPRPATVISMLLGHRAERGMTAIAHEGWTGSGADVLRRSKLDCARRDNLTGFLDEFWPDPPRREMFQPEPGCSDATYHGSGAQVMALATSMLDAAATELGRHDNRGQAVAHLVALAASEHDGLRAARLTWPEDIVVGDGHSDYEIRIAPSALAEMRAWWQRSARRHGLRVETGGLLFGQRDDAAGVLWVTEVTGPPPDSVQSETEFVCGIQGNDRFRDEKHRRGRGSLEFVGMWHTHPAGRAMPSERDVASMLALVMTDDPPLPQSLALIIGGAPDNPELGAYVFDRSKYSESFNLLRFHDRTVRPGPAPQKLRDVGLALSGGGSRAIAFQLGCMRALSDRNVIPRIAVTSGVSGGSVMTAAWAYSDDDFASFDARVVALLRRGLAKSIARRIVLGRTGPLAGAALATAGIAALSVRLVDALLRAAAHVPGISKRALSRLRLQPPFRRFASRTDALRATLNSELLHGRRLTSSRRGDIDVIINACELRTGSAFRFGSRESSCWRLGTLEGNDLEVAEAVAASAAYPVLLPALDRRWRFVARDGEVHEHRVVLTDGGVYDNLGTSCLEPGRSADFTYNIFPVDFIIACDAGQGILRGDPIPYFWISRMTRSFESVFRKAQDAGRARLHQYVADGQLRGFVFPYLGNQDAALPVRPTDLVARETVGEYPTDFSAMSDQDIELIALRGEQLTRLLIDRYCPEL